MLKRRPVLIITTMSVVVASALLLAGVAGATATKTAVAKAKTELVVKSDFPKGWTTTKYVNSGSSKTPEDMSTCLHVSEKSLNYQPPAAYSPNFNLRSADLTVEEQIGIFTSQKILHEQYADNFSPQAVLCENQAYNTPAAKIALEKGSPKGMTFGTFRITALARPNVGEPAWANLYSIPLSYSGRTYKSQFTEVMIVKGNEIVALNFTTDLGIPFPTGLVTKIETDAAKNLT